MLAAVGVEDRLLIIAVSFLTTLGVYWLAETYVHFMAQREADRQELDAQTVGVIARVGLPLISVSFVPLAVLLGASLLGLPVDSAASWALYTNMAVLLLEGYRISRSAGIVGFRLVVAVAFTGFLGVVLVGLKIAIGH